MKKLLYLCIRKLNNRTMNQVKFNERQIILINNIINYNINEERSHLEEQIDVVDDVEPEELTDADLYDKYKDDETVNDHIWFSLYELQQFIEERVGGKK